MGPRPAGRSPAALPSANHAELHAWGDIAAIVRLARCANMPVTLKRYGGTLAYRR